MQRRITIEGPDLDAMTPDRVERALVMLGDVFSDSEVKLELIPDQAPTSETSQRHVLEQDELIKFAEREEVDSNAFTAQTLWHALANSWWKPQKLSESDPCPVEFTDDPLGMPVTTNWRDRYLPYLVAESLPPTALWLYRQQEERTGLGDRTISLLADFMEGELEVDQLILAQLRTLVIKGLTNPSAEQFRMDETSCFLDNSPLETGPSRLVTLDSLIRFARQKLGLHEAQYKTLPSVLDGVAEVLYGTAELPPEETLAPSQVIDGLVFLGTRPVKKSVCAAWGVAPNNFVEVIDGGFSGEYIISNLKGPTTKKIITRFIREIHDDSSAAG